MGAVVYGVPMKTYEVTATITITVRKQLRARSRKQAVSIANQSGDELIPLFNYGDDLRRPKFISFDEGWFDEDSISNQLLFE